MLSCVESMKSLTSLDPLIQEFIDQLVALAEAAAEMVTEAAITAGPTGICGYDPGTRQEQEKSYRLRLSEPYLSQANCAFVEKGWSHAQRSGTT